MTQEWMRELTQLDLNRFRAEFGDRIEITRDNLLKLEHGHRITVDAVAKKVLNAAQYTRYWALVQAAAQEQGYAVGQEAIATQLLIVDARSRYTLGELLPHIERENGIYDTVRIDWCHRFFLRMVDALLTVLNEKDGS